MTSTKIGLIHDLVYKTSKMGKNSDDSDLENSSESEHDWSDEENDKQDEDEPEKKVAKLGQSQREFLTETKNLLRKNMF